MLNKKSYLTCCVDSTAEKIDAMTEKAREISYKTLLKHVSKAELDEVFPVYAGCKGLSLATDYAVSFFKSVFDGKPCVYVCHSMIEYIFV